MPYDRARDAAGSRNANANGPARNWYDLTDEHVGAQELPAYGRCLRVHIGDGATTPLTIVGVPIGETSDEAVHTVLVDETEYLLLGFRRIVSLDGGETIPEGVSIVVVTD